MFLNNVKIYQCTLLNPGKCHLQVKASAEIQRPDGKPVFHLNLCSDRSLCCNYRSVADVVNIWHPDDEFVEMGGVL